MQQQSVRNSEGQLVSRRDRLAGWVGFKSSETYTGARPFLALKRLKEFLDKF